MVFICKIAFIENDNIYTQHYDIFIHRYVSNTLKIIKFKSHITKIISQDLTFYICTSHNSSRWFRPLKEVANSNDLYNHF